MSKIVTQHDTNLKAKPGNLAAPDYSCIPMQGGIGLVQADRGFSDTIDLPEFVREQISKARLENNTEIQLIMVQEEELFASLQSNRNSLGEVIELLIKSNFVGNENSPVNYVKLERAARVQKVTLTNTMCFSGVPSIAGPAVKLTAEIFKIYQIAEQLGCELRSMTGSDDTFATQVSIPINARVSAPDPSLLQAEIVHVRRAANSDAIINPIPRMNQTG